MHSTSFSKRFQKTPVGKIIMCFVADTRGTLTIESLIVLPMYLSWFILTFLLFDLYRVAGTNEKVAFTISDIVSRQGNIIPIDQNFVDGLKDLNDYALQNRADTWVRVTSFDYDAIEDEYILNGSLGSGTAPYNEAALESLRNRIPVMASGDSAVIVETRSDTGVTFLGSDGILNTFIVTRPRFVPSIPVGGPLPVQN